MNLELLDPFRRQIPERISDTIELPAKVTPGIVAPSDFENYQNQSWIHNTAITYLAVNQSGGKNKQQAQKVSKSGDVPISVQYNRRGSHLAIGYSSGKISVHDFVSNNVISALYYPAKKKQASPMNADVYGDPISFLRWGRRGRSLLTGSVASPVLRLFDLTIGKRDADAMDSPVAREVVLPCRPIDETSSLQIHPRCDEIGLVTLEDGSLALFQFPSRDNEVERKQKIWFLHRAESFSREDSSGEISRKRVRGGNDLFVTGAIFVPNKVHDNNVVTDENGTSFKVRVLAIADCGKILGVDVNIRVAGQGPESETVSIDVTTELPGKSRASEIKLSRNGNFFYVTSRDNSIRLYQTKGFWNSKDLKPLFTFQDQCSDRKAPWVVCDFSGDAEYIFGGRNNGNSYEMHIWNTNTGQLMEQMNGPKVSMHGVSWHPIRPFVAIATSDGFVDVWGPSVNWTAFAPDFHALQENVEYIEREDEFDTVVDDINEEEENVTENALENLVDVVSVDGPAVFNSDSEDETDVFQFPLIGLVSKKHAVSSSSSLRS